MTAAHLVYLAGTIVCLLGAGLLLNGANRGRGTLKILSLEISGGAGLILCVLGFAALIYTLRQPPDQTCVIFCPAPAVPVALEPRLFNFPERDTRQSDGKSGHMSDIQVSLIPPDAANPNGRWTATWIYTGSGGTQKGSQFVNIKFMGRNGADLFTENASLARDGCHYGGIRQDFGKPLQVPMTEIDNVTIEPSITEGTTGKC